MVPVRGVEGKKMSDEDQKQPNIAVATTEDAEVSQVSEMLEEEVPVRIPLYCRTMFPTNLVLSAEDIREFSELLKQVNERAKEFEFQNLDLSKFESAEHAKARVNELIRLEYSYIAKNGDRVQGLDIPKTNERIFPESLQTFFISNSEFTKRAIDTEPMNKSPAFVHLWVYHFD